MAETGYGRTAGGYGRWGIARTYALIFGIAYLAVALLEVLFARGIGLRIGGSLILKFEIIQNLVHWAIGLLVLWSFFSGEATARAVARVVGIVLVALAIWGFIDRGSLGEILGYGRALPQAYNWIHLITGAAALFAGFASRNGYGRGTVAR